MSNCTKTLLDKGKNVLGYLLNLRIFESYMPFYRDTQNRQTTTKLKVNLLIISKHIIFAPTISSSK